MRFAYADPPYPGEAKRLYGDHPDYAGEIDHEALITRLLDEFDGWALSTATKSLPRVLRLCPDDVLVGCWLKRATSPPMGNNRMYSWEPVIFSNPRDPSLPTRLHCEVNADQYTFRSKRAGYVVGAKPRGFCNWVFECAGLRADDHFTDLFPGSGAVTEAWEAWRGEPSLLSPTATTNSHGEDGSDA